LKDISTEKLFELLAKYGDLLKKEESAITFEGLKELSHDFLREGLYPDTWAA